jgi:hypothetical protein
MILEVLLKKRFILYNKNQNLNDQGKSGFSGQRW